jgi:lysophospholipase L1-like esterase
LINKENKIVSFSNYIMESSTDFNVVPIGIYANEDIFFGIQGNIKFVQNNLTPDEYTLNSDGLYEDAASNVGVGNTVTINKTSSDRYCFAIQLEVESPIETKANFENVSEAIQENNVSTSWLPKGLQLEPSSLRYRNISEKFGLVGRWYKQTVNNLICNVTNNCGSEIFLRAIAIGSAAKIVINWQAMTETNAYYTYSIDGGEMTRKIISENEISIPAGIHNIRIVTDGITENIGKWQNGTGFAFSGIESEACFIGGILPKNPRIMFFGDSITEGIRALGVTTGDMGDTNSATGAFPWFTCLKLGAVSHRVGYGASGITVNGSFHKADDALKYLYSQLYVPNYYPDAIVINHGTNDGSASANDFKTAYNQFLKDIKAIYSGVRVFVMIPFNQAHAATIRTIVSENEGVYLIETSSWTGIEKADGTHPTKAGAEVAGNYLANAMIDLIYG